MYALKKHAKTENIKETYIFMALETQRAQKSYTLQCTIVKFLEVIKSVKSKT